METKLFKRKRGKPLKNDYSLLKIGQAIPFGAKAQKNPYPYADYWNSRKGNKIKIEVWRDENNIAYAKRVK